jgi:uncharacterized delta-60 repeat protein
MERATRTRIGFITRSRAVVGSLLAGMALLMGTTSSPVLANHYKQFAVARYTDDGSLDPHFHDDGKLVTDFGDWIYVQVNDLALTPIPAGQEGHQFAVVAGRAANSFASNFALARYLPNGLLDASFDDDGKLLTNFDGDYEAATAIAMKSDASMVVAGYATTSTGYQFALAAYDYFGNLDLSFDQDGKLVSDFTSDAQAFAIVLQNDDKIVVAGTSGGDFALARYHANGNPDTSFSGDGKLRTHFETGSATVYDMALQSDGRIVVAGQAGPDNSSQFALARYLPNGNLDPTFDGDGKLVTNCDNYREGARALAIQHNGKIVVAGFGGIIDGSPDGGSQFALARYNSNGSLDTSFHQDGKLLTDISGTRAYAHDLVLQPKDGKIVVAGWSGSSDWSQFALARYNSNGSLDTSFHGNGKLLTDFDSGSMEGARAMAIQADGYIVAAGFSE